MKVDCEWDKTQSKANEDRLLKILVRQQLMQVLSTRNSDCQIQIIAFRSLRDFSIFIFPSRGCMISAEGDEPRVDVKTQKITRAKLKRIK